MATTRIGIVGAGAVGSVVGGLLTKAGYDVTLIDQWPEHVETMRRHGLRLSGLSGEQTIPVRALHVHEAQSIETPLDLAFVSVKAYDTEWATHLACAYLAPDGLIVDCQNGINDHRVAAIAGKERTLGCVILIGSGMYEPGHALRTDGGTIGFKVGEHDGLETERARRVVEILNAVAPTRLTTNLWGERWSKLALNCMVNPIAALSGYGTAECRTHEGPRRLAIHIGAEVITVGRACGHDIEPTWGIAAQRFVDAAAGHGVDVLLADLAKDTQTRGRSGRPSMLQDVLRGRRTEIDALNGYVVERGREHGIPTPFNAAIVAEFRRRGVKLVPDPANLEPLLAMLPRR